MIVPDKIFIIPYRNREKEKNIFIDKMKYILEDIQSDTYEIFFVHQNDKRPFNRGAMKNIGFLAIRDKYPDNYKQISFIFHDIDTYPIKKNLLNYNTKSGIVKHFYGFDFALGGIFSITGEDFEKCGGFPNLWGWGLEDTMIQRYIQQNKIKIDRSNFFPFKNKNIIQTETTTKRLTTKKEPWDFENNNIKETFNHIKNLKYNFENEYIQVTNFITKSEPEKDIYYMHNTLKGLAQLDNRFQPKNMKPTNKFNNNPTGELKIKLIGTARQYKKPILKMLL